MLEISVGSWLQKGIGNSSRGLNSVKRKDQEKILIRERIKGDKKED